MSQSSFLLDPEDQLMHKLSPRWRQRFEKALALIGEDLCSPLNWPNIAEKCHISSNHFHHMFRVVFNETPAQYQRRLRLKKAVHDLYMQPGVSVTDIALATGFSSSQALAKALKRELGFSASEVRSRDEQQADVVFDSIMKKLGHPGNTGQALEAQLAEDIPFEVIEYACDAIYSRECKAKNIEEMITAWCELCPDEKRQMICISGWEALADPANHSIDIALNCKPEFANNTLEKQRYLSCRIRISTQTAYFAAWDRLFEKVMQSDIEPDYNKKIIELVHNPWAFDERYMDISFLLPIEH